MYHVEPRDRIKSAIAVGIVHAILGYMLLFGLGARIGLDASESLKMFNISQDPPPPPPEAVPLREKTMEPAPKPKPAPKDPEGAAAPPNITSRPTEIVAPKPVVLLPVPPPVVFAPVAGPGAAATSGNAPIRGPGTGAGGQGIGTGSGRYGDGGGGGGGSGVRVPARCLRCELPDTVAPRRLLDRGFSGTVFLRFTVLANGRVRPCTVLRSSGDRELDSATCRGIERLYRYRPALDYWGEPVSQTVTGPHEWDLRSEPDRWIEADVPDDGPYGD